MTKLFLQIPIGWISVCLVLCVLSVLAVLFLRAVLKGKFKVNEYPDIGIIIDPPPPPFNPELIEQFTTIKGSPTFDVSRLTEEEIADLEKLLGYKIH